MISNLKKFLVGVAIVLVLSIAIITVINSLVSKFSPSIHRPEPVTESSLIEEGVLKGFIQDSNSTVYDRLADEIVLASVVAGKKYSIPPVLVLSVMQAESSFNINAISKENAKGLMQINLSVWGDELKKQLIIEKDSDVYDPKCNIYAGCFILRQYINETKDFEKAMNKYLGAYYKPYIDKIGRNVGNIWMQNISKGINATYNIK